MKSGRPSTDMNSLAIIHEISAKNLALNSMALLVFKCTRNLGQKCVATVSGFGLDSYRLAVEGILSQLAG